MRRLKRSGVVSYRNSTSNHNRARNIYRQVKVVSYRNSTSNHNLFSCLAGLVVLYLIEILHQTTTYPLVGLRVVRCILSKFYIKPQPGRSKARKRTCCILSKFYIKPQRRGWPTLWIWRCILSKFYIKPQPVDRNSAAANRCILSKFYIKPQRSRWSVLHLYSCILSKFYIKPQPP